MRAVEVGKESITKQSETPYASVISRNRRMVLEEDFNEIQRPQLIDHVPAKDFASSVGTALRCFKSLLFPTSMMTMFESALSRSSFNHRVTFTYVACFEMSYTSSAPTAPR